MSEPNVREREIEIRGEAARVFVGGQGPPLLLVHGGFGGAQMHWSRAWDLLAKDFHVIAPDLPGLGRVDQPVLGSVAEYSAWLGELLRHLELERAAFVGNSFGAGLAYSLAGRDPALCSALVMVNGSPIPAPSPLLLRIGQTGIGGALMRSLLRRLVYNPRALGKAFVDPLRAPGEIKPMLEAGGAELVPRFAALLVAGDGPPEPTVQPLLLWGSGDRLPGSTMANAEKLHQALPGSELTFLELAGHLPQLEQPEAFAKSLAAFLG